MGKAGQSTRKMAAERRSKALVYLFFAAAIVLVLFFVTLNQRALGISGLGLLALVFCFVIGANFFISRSDRYVALKRRALRGARGEETVGRILDNLGPDFYPLHDIESQFGNIDHIVLSRFNGVFLVETKAHGGKVSILDDRLLVNGRPPEKDFIKQSLNNTYWFKEKLNQTFGLDIWITPVVVFANAFVSRGKPIKNVTVINKKYLPDLLRHGRSSQATIDLWNRREDVARLLGLRMFMPVNAVPISPSAVPIATPVSRTPRRARKSKHLFGLQPRQLGLLASVLVFDLLIFGTGLLLLLS